MSAGIIHPTRDVGTMLLLLPLNLRRQILAHVALSRSIAGDTLLLPTLDDRDLKDRTQTLASCCLVCKAWFRICHPQLARVISLRTPRQLQSLAVALSSATHPIGAHTTELSIPADSGCHVALPYLSTKLPSLRYLAIEGYPTDRYPSLVTHLQHFRTVTQLRLSQLSFYSFWDFRCVVLALPALSELHIHAVDLPDSNPFQGPSGSVPSLFSAPQTLRQLHIDGQVWWNPLWIWVAHSQTQYRKLINPTPILNSRDADAIWQLMLQISRGGGHQSWFRCRWSNDEEHQRSKLSVPSNGDDLRVTLPRSFLLRFRADARGLQ